MLTILLFLHLMTEPVKDPTPTVTPAEQIQLLIAQREELMAENAYLKKTLARIDVVNTLAAGWNARGCILISKPDGTLDCKKPEEKKEIRK